MKKQAILLAGGVNYQYSYTRYANDLGFAYKVLTECCNYSSEDIKVLHSFGKPIKYDGIMIDTCMASKENLRDVLSKSIFQLEKEDEFVLIVSNHGDNDLINLWDQKYILFDELADVLKQIKAKKIIVLGECYAGNFIRDDIENCCILAGNEKDRVTYVHSQNRDYDEFLYNLLSFLYGKYPDTKLKISKAEVNIERAFEFAVKKDAYNPANPHYQPRYNKRGEVWLEIPQMFTNIADLSEVLK